MQNYNFLSMNDLLTQDSKPCINHISLAVYNQFYEKVLLKLRFSYVLPDYSVFDVLFERLGLFHLLGIHHIDPNMQAKNFSRDIDNGLNFSAFKNNTDLAIRERFNMMKNRIKMFSCIYYAMRTGRLFETSSGKVHGTQTLKADFVIYKDINGEGMTIPLRDTGGKLTPVSILADKRKYSQKHIDLTKEKNINRLDIIDMGAKTVKETVHFF